MYLSQRCDGLPGLSLPAWLECHRLCCLGRFFALWKVVVPVLSLLLAGLVVTAPGAYAQTVSAETPGASPVLPVPDPCNSGSMQAPIDIQQAEKLPINNLRFMYKPADLDVN